jgi:hypothetical protein
VTPNDGGESVWKEYWRKARPVVVDLFLWLTVLAALLIVFGGLKVMEAAGYIKAKIEILEDIHFIGSAGILLLFLFDMFMKMLSLVGKP